jgi:mannose-6-phosphate isomerase-like protein (cupin superfamily)
MPKGHGEPLLPFANWLWDELGKRARRLNRASEGQVKITIPPLEPDALDFVLRLASFCADEVYMSKAGIISQNMWRRPVVNVLDDDTIDGGERALTSKNKAGSVERFLMPLLGPGRAFFRVRVVEKDESAACFHTHSDVDEYYLILAGKGTLRHNGKETEVKVGDMIGKPAGP